MLLYSYSTRFRIAWVVEGFAELASLEDLLFLLANALLPALCSPSPRSVP